MSLTEYINTYFSGNRSEFARRMGKHPQQITKWINGGWIVVNHKLYSPRGDVPENVSGGSSAGD